MHVFISHHCPHKAAEEGEKNLEYVTNGLSSADGKVSVQNTGKSPSGNLSAILVSSVQGRE